MRWADRRVSSTTIICNGRGRDERRSFRRETMPNTWANSGKSWRRRSRIYKSRVKGGRQSSPRSSWQCWAKEWVSTINPFWKPASRARTNLFACWIPCSKSCWSRWICCSKVGRKSSPRFSFRIYSSYFSPKSASSTLKPYKYHRKNSIFKSNKIPLQKKSSICKYYNPTNNNCSTYKYSLSTIRFYSISSNSS